MTGMEIQLNGERRELSPAASVADLLEELGLSKKRVAVEKNGMIVPRSRFVSEPVNDRDRIEIVQAIGGG